MSHVRSKLKLGLQLGRRIARAVFNGVALGLIGAHDQLMRWDVEVSINTNDRTFTMEFIDNWEEMRDQSVTLPLNKRSEVLRFLDNMEPGIMTMTITPKAASLARTNPGYLLSQESMLFPTIYARKLMAVHFRRKLFEAKISEEVKATETTRVEKQAQNKDKASGVRRSEKLWKAECDGTHTYGYSDQAKYVYESELKLTSMQQWLVRAVAVDRVPDQHLDPMHEREIGNLYEAAVEQEALSRMNKANRES